MRNLPLKPRWILPRVIVLALAATGVSFAQNAERALSGDDAPRSRIDLDFKGGTLEGYVTTLAQLDPTFNVVLRPDVKETQVPALTLKNVTATAALEMVPLVLDSPRRRIVIQSTASARGSRVFVLLAQDRNDPKAPPAKITQVFSLKHLVGVGPETSAKARPVFDAIDTALGFLAEGSETPVKPELKFHGASGLLLVRGEPSELDLVKQVLAELGAGAGGEGSDHDLKSAVKRLEDELVRLRAELDELKAEKKGTAPSNEKPR